LSFPAHGIAVRAPVSASTARQSLDPKSCASSLLPLCLLLASCAVDQSQLPDAGGAWHMQREVHHGRLRCGSYETGIQIGRGAPACSAVEWLTDIEYVTRLRHCNSASRVHAGQGRFPGLADSLQDVSCVRIAVRCEGAC
jgi:hypothetical protein